MKFGGEGGTGKGGKYEKSVKMAAGDGIGVLINSVESRRAKGHHTSLSGSSKTLRRVEIVCGAFSRCWRDPSRWGNPAEVLSAIWSSPRRAEWFFRGRKRPARAPGGI